MQLHTYLNYGGNCEQAFRFYEQHLGGKITALMRHGEQPTTTDLPPEWNGKVLHARMDLGGTELLGADIPGYQPMRSAYLSLTISSDEEAERIYGLLSDGGSSSCPCRRPFSPHVLRCSGTNSERPGCSSTRGRNTHRRHDTLSNSASWL